MSTFSQLHVNMCARAKRSSVTIPTENTKNNTNHMYMYIGARMKSDLDNVDCAK